MRTEVHPAYHQIEVTCVCGNTIATGSTRETFSVEICSACHPFYTGTQKIIDTQGRIERFKNRYAKSDQAVKAEKTKTEPVAKAERKRRFNSPFARSADRPSEAGPCRPPRKS